MKVIDLRKSIAEQDEVVRRCLEFIQCNGGASIACGRHTVDETGIYVNVSEYTTHLFEDSKWEAHKKYIDLQLVLEGVEKIGVSDISKMELGEYHPDNDYLPCDGAAEHSYVLDENTAILLMPEDAHMPGICFEEKAAKVKKAVFKIPV